MYKGAYSNCKFCHGRGCISCSTQRKKDIEKIPEPMFTASVDNPEDMEAFKKVFGADALQSAFGFGGGGMPEIQENAAIERLKQLLREDK